MREPRMMALLGLSLVVLACDQAPEPRALAGSDTPAFAVVSSDYGATAISLLDADGELVADDYIDSGSTPAGLVTALSGDVALPTRSGEPTVLAILDRYKTDVITRIRLADGALLGQVKTHTPPGQGAQSAYSSNPQDYVFIDAQTAWVSRFEPNLDPRVAARDRGNDLLRIDPSAMARSDERIDFSPLDTEAMRVDPDSGESEAVHVYARPSGMVRLGRTLVVGLARMAFDFSAMGPGMVALVDLDTRALTGLELPGLANCSSVRPVPGAEPRVLVACQGFYRDDPRGLAGLALVELSDDGAQVVETYRAGEHPERPAFSAGAPLGGAVVAAVANDFSGSVRDVLAVLDLATGETTELASHGPSAGVFGAPTFDAATGLLLVPDASVDADLRPTAGVRRFRRTESGRFEALATVRVAAQTDLPARVVVAL